jgi:hypothetical protein
MAQEITRLLQPPSDSAAQLEALRFVDDQLGPSSFGDLGPLFSKLAADAEARRTELEHEVRMHSISNGFVPEFRLSSSPQSMIRFSVCFLPPVLLSLRF